MDTHTVLIEIIIAIAFKKYKLSVSSTLKFSLVVQMVKHLCAMQGDLGLILDGEDLLEKEMAPLSLEVRTGSLVGYRP